MLAFLTLVADFSRGVQISGSATHFSRPTPTTLAFANGSMPALGVGLHEHALGERGKLALDVDGTYLVVDHLLVTHHAMERQR
jgi:hypothetical protein